MKKTSVLAALTVTGLVLASPAHADADDNPGGRRARAWWFTSFRGSGRPAYR